MRSIKSGSSTLVKMGISTLGTGNSIVTILAEGKIKKTK